MEEATKIEAKPASGQAAKEKAAIERRNTIVKSISSETERLGWQGTALKPHQWQWPETSEIIGGTGHLIDKLSPIVDELPVATEYKNDVLKYLGLAELYRRGQNLRSKETFSTPENFFDKLEADQWAAALTTTYVVAPKIFEVYSTGERRLLPKEPAKHETIKKPVQITLNKKILQQSLQAGELAMIEKMLGQIGAKISPSSNWVELETSLPDMITYMAHQASFEGGESMEKDAITIKQIITETLESANNLNWPGYSFSQEAREKIEQDLGKIAGDFILLSQEKNLDLSDIQKREVIKFLCLAQIVIEGPRLSKTKSEVFTPAVKVADSAKWNRALVTMGLVYPKLEGEPQRDKTVSVTVGPELDVPGVTPEKGKILRQTIKNLGGQEATNGIITLETNLPEMMLSIAHSTATPTSK